MENVKFLSDYRGVRTNEIFFEKGSVVELANDPAYELVEMGIAKIVKEPEPKPKAKKAKKKSK